MAVRHGLRRIEGTPAGPGIVAAALVLAAAGARAAVLGDAGAATEALLHGRGRPHALRATLPLGLESLPPDLGAKVRLAFWLASVKIADRPSCAAMFARLGADGPATLAASRYGAAPWTPRRGRCGDGVAAYTDVGTPGVALCPVFAYLSADEAARIVLHEALHSAGLGERPPDDRAPTSEEINRMVIASCGL